MKALKNIDFDKPSNSFWIASTEKENYPALEDDIKVDIAVIGGGIAGINTAYQLSKHKVSTAIFEADRILHGTTGNTTAKVTSQHNLIYHRIKNQISEEFARQYADANELAINLIENIARENNIDCDYIRQSAYIYTLSEEYIDKISDEADTASSLGIKAACLDNTPLPFAVKAAIRFENQAQFHPLKFCTALAKVYTDNGGKIFEKTRIVNIEKQEKYVLTTNTGVKIRAEKVVIATHYPFFNKPGLYFTRIYTERSYVAAINAKEKYPGGMYISAEKPTRSLRSQNSDNREIILVGGDNHKTGQGENTKLHYNALLEFADANFTITDIPYRWSTQDCMTMDGLPFVGHFTEDMPDIYIATGFGKWGMTNSIVSSLILKDLIINGRSQWQDVYNPSRETASASAKDFIKENLNVAGELIKGKTEALPECIEIKCGEAKIIRADGERAGAYRDNDGKLHIVNTTCTHMGCELNWNAAEKSWDCPCHGSRFNIDGDVIEGPALRPLSMNYDVNTIEKIIKDNY